MTTPAPTAEREVKKRILALEVEKEEYERDELSAERDFEDEPEARSDTAEQHVARINLAI
jgi:hypothetical protein